MSTPTFVSGNGRARDSTVHCRYSEEGTRFSLNNLRYRKLPDYHHKELLDCHHKGRFGHTLQHVPNSSHWASRDEPLQPRGARRPPPAAADDPWGVALWLQHGRAAAKRRETGPSPGACSTGRPRRGRPESPTGPTRGLRGAQHRSEPSTAGRGPSRGPPQTQKARRGGLGPGRGSSTGSDPSADPCPPHRPLPRLTAAASPPQPRTEPSQVSPRPRIARPLSPSRRTPTHPPASPQPRQLLPQPRRRLIPGGGRRQWAPIGARAAAADGRGPRGPSLPAPDSRRGSRPPRGENGRESRITELENHRGMESWNHRGWKRSLILSSRTVHPARPKSPVNL